jgi:hypothetical protein
LSKKEVIAAVDGDEIAFVIAAACEKRSIKVVNKINQAEASFKHRTAFKDFMNGIEVPDEHFTVEDVQEADTLANALHSVKVTLDSIKKACGADKLEIYLSGKGNFRDELPLPSKYKSNRKDLIRPLLLEDIKLYLINNHKAKVVQGMEADDMIAMRMYDGFKRDQMIIGVTQDKDACGNQGWLFNPEKMVRPDFISGLGELYIDESGSNAKVRGTGRKWGYLQWLIGDPVDGYKPTEVCGARYGEKSAYKLLDELTTDKDCIKAVYDQYLKWYPGEVKYTAWNGEEVVTDAVGMMQLYMECYRMRRFDNDIVDVKAILKSMGIIE